MIYLNERNDFMEFKVRNFDANGKEFDIDKVVLPPELSYEIWQILKKADEK